MNLPIDFLNNMKELLSKDYPKYLASMNNSPVSAIRINPLKVKQTEEQNVCINLDAYKKVAFASSGYIVKSSKIGKHPYHMAGAVYVQEPSSMLSVESSGLSDEKDKDNLIVLDLCAAPGGKSGQIAEILAGQGVLVSNEIDRSRARVLQSNIERMGYTNVIITNSNPNELANNLQGVFDYIFVDAPCGGEGMFRKDPDTIKEWKPERLVSNAKRQKEILTQANKMLKQGGKLIYSTCTFSRQENEDIAEWFALNFGYKFILPNSEVLNATSYLDNPACRRFYPYLADGEGQFVCVMQKLIEQSCNLKTKKLPKLQNTENKLTNEFLNNFNLPLAVNLTKVGCYICLINQNLQNILQHMQFLPVINAGVSLGSITKDRFIPHHNAFTALSTYCKLKINFNLNNINLSKYLHGEELVNNTNFQKGYAAIMVDNFALGGAKISGANLKNLLPKGLRI